MTSPQRGSGGARDDRGSGAGRGFPGKGDGRAPRGGAAGRGGATGRAGASHRGEAAGRSAGGVSRNRGGASGRSVTGRDGASSRDERPQWQDRRPQGQRASGDRPGWQDRRPQGERPSGDRPQWRDRRPQGEGPTGDRPQRNGAPRGDRGGWRERRPSDDRRGGPARGSGRPARAGEERRPPLPPGPAIPDWVDVRDLDPAVRGALRGLDPRNVERVAGHLVAAGTLVEEDPATALAHARAARDRASRVAAVREAVGVAAYHAEDYAEAARELRAYRRMSGDPGYRAVLADCERALGRPEVALRLVAEALADHPDPEETAELRIVESGVRLDLGENAAARLVLEAALGDRLDPASLTPGDTVRLRLASAYADLLEIQGEHERATEWLTAIAGADPEDLTGAVDRLGIEFTDLEDDDVDDLATEADEKAEDAERPQPSADPAAPEVVTPLPEDDHGLGRSFDEEVEAEVAELLGETDPRSDDDAADGADTD
jgi:tetratricopeptide (TPR) repeat protein